MLISSKKVKILEPEDVAKVMEEILQAESEVDRGREHFWVLGLNAKNTVQYIELVSLGTLTQSLIHPRETYRMAVLKGVASILAVHNHPSGDCEPSREDLIVSERLQQAGEILGINLENQKEEGTIEIQHKALKEYAEKNAHTLVEIFSDNGVSGAKDLEDRPGLYDLFNSLESNQDIKGVLIYKLDRLARDLYIQEHLIKKLQDLNKSLVSIKEPNLDSRDPMRKAFRQFMGIVSELEKAFITMRLSGGRINKARKGGFSGGCPAMGYRAKDKQLTIDTKSSETIRTIFSLRNDLDMTLREIAQLLNESGIPTARNSKWYAGTVKYILENPIYQGIMQYSNVRVSRQELALV